MSTLNSKVKRTGLVVGAGSIGERHVRCFLATGRAEISVCETNSGLLESISKRYTITAGFDSIKQALLKRPDLTVICAPAHLHVPLGLAALQSSSHLLVEKPLSTTFAGVDSLHTKAVARGLVAGVAYVYRAHPALAAMRQTIGEGRFGKPLQIVAAFGQHFPFYRPAYRNTYYQDRATGGGAVQDAFTHIINAGEWLVGPVDALVADVDRQKLEGVEVEDTVHVLTRHGKVMAASASTSIKRPTKERSP